jgi:3',5'-cyclic AMP phosphodiesterase CpdA
VALDHPVLASGALDSSRIVRFVAFGDQRALAEEEWPALIEHVASLHATTPVDFILDTGDIIADGRATDQFHYLRNLLRPVRTIPYVVAVGNHELHNGDSAEARRNTAKFLAYLDPAFGADRMYFRKDVGRAAFLVLDSNALVYGMEGEREALPDPIEPGSPEAEQIEWLDAEFASLSPDDLIVVAMHHPLIQAAAKHAGQARSLWNGHVHGRRLLDWMADAGVDLILTGHTHTYERYRLEREDGRTVALVNLSGRPRDSLLWFGAGDRRPADIRGEEASWLAEEGFEPLAGWTISQESVMSKSEEADQLAVFEISPNGRLTMEVRFLDEDAPEGIRSAPVVELHSGL